MIRGPRAGARGAVSGIERISGAGGSDAIAAAAVLWRNPLATAGVIAAAFAVAVAVVHASGGTKFAHLHIVYIPIILAAFRFKIAGGIGAALIATVLMGPFMPLDVATGQAQPVGNWIMRGVYLTLIGGVIGLLYSMIDRRRDALFRAENFDRTTDLPLYVAFRREVARTLARPDGRDGRHALINIVLSNSTLISSLFGPGPHEEIMQSGAARIRAVMPARSAISRGGPARFLVFVPDTDTRDALDLATDALAACRSTDVRTDLPIQASYQVGLACYPQHGHDPDELVRASYLALVAGESRTAPVGVFERTKEQVLRDNLALLSDLEEALEQGALRFFAQPKISLRDGAVAGAELLARWEHPTRGLVSPGQFISIAEQSNLISRITRQNLVAARGYIARTGEIVGHQRFRVAVNVTGNDLTDADFPELLVTVFRGCEELLERLELEVTETAVIEDFDAVIPVLSGLRGLGVRISIDDFGTGYSSLRYLKDLPADTLKIDQSFVADVLGSERDGALVRLTIELARTLGLRTVAEGVENADVASWLTDAGCDDAQGFHYAPALSPTQWESWLTARIADPGTGPNPSAGAAP